MTTENTDAATRILAKAIRKLSKALAQADDYVGALIRERDRIMSSQTYVRVALCAGSDHGLSNAALADKRMAELAELRQKLAELESLTCQPMPDYAARIDKALEALPSSPFDPYVAEAVRILTGEESA